jgi:hypothetical protein
VVSKQQQQQQQSLKSLLFRRALLLKEEEEEEDAFVGVKEMKELDDDFSLHELHRRTKKRGDVNTSARAAKVARSQS